jgi:AraC-like DNA-binding protein
VIILTKAKVQEFEFKKVISSTLANDELVNCDSVQIIDDKVDKDEEEQKRVEVFISQVTKDRLLKDFEKVHQSKFFIKKRVNLSYLAELLGTNQRYASYIVKCYIGLDFNDYVQDARINYIIEIIERDPELLNLKFSVLAEQAGFSSVSKFSTVFKTVKGISPSEYFQKIRL